MIIVAESKVYMSIVNRVQSERFIIICGMSQGYAMSPWVFNL